jgi:chemotaxis protein CheY-P-specific phosphatase CheC
MNFILGSIKSSMKSLPTITRIIKTIVTEMMNLLNTLKSGSSKFATKEQKLKIQEEEYQLFQFVESKVYKHNKKYLSKMKQNKAITKIRSKILNKSKSSMTFRKAYYRPGTRSHEECEVRP